MEIKGMVDKINRVLFKIVALYLNRYGLYVTKILSKKKISISLTEEAIISSDFVRLATLELCAEQIKNKGILGSMAELGVYRGRFSRHINRLFPDRRLYLFDTFEGFDSEHLKMEKKLGLATKDKIFETNTDIVLAAMPHPKVCKIMKGLFPKTAVGIEDKFAFVSLDADLFYPTYEGLKFFYPRMSLGGYIFVHDYNNSDWGGIKKAIDQFVMEFNVQIVPIADAQGTVIIVKS